MKKIQTAIIVIALIIMIIIISIVIIKKNEDNNKTSLENNISNTVGNNSIEENNIVQNDKLSRMEYTILNKAANTYIQTINKNNSIYFDMNNDEINVKERNKYVLSLLSDSYINRNKINSNNLEEHIEFLEEQLFLVPIKMKRIKSENIKTYVIDGITINMNYNLKDEIRLIINIDYQNKTFSVEPTLDNYDEINNVDIVNNIEKMDNNEYTIKNINIENIVKEYMNNLKRMMLAKPELAYEHLDEEYRNKRFGSLDKFKEYIEKNKEEIKKMYIDKYLANSFEDYSQYVGKDKYNNTYIFNEKDPLDYTILLDTYTINSNEFKQAYDESKDEYRVKLNTDKWIKMLNNRDYENAYKCLDRKFREEKFGTEEEFEEYMREKFPLHYKLSVGITEEVNGVYKQRIILQDITGESNEQIENTIIMQLKDNYEFVMSFEVK